MYYTQTLECNGCQGLLALFEASIAPQTYNYSKPKKVDWEYEEEDTRYTYIYTKIYILDGSHEGKGIYNRRFLQKRGVNRGSNVGKNHRKKPLDSKI